MVAFENNLAAASVALIRFLTLRVEGVSLSNRGQDARDTEAGFFVFMEIY